MYEDARRVTPAFSDLGNLGFAGTLGPPLKYHLRLNVPLSCSAMKVVQYAEHVRMNNLLPGPSPEQLPICAYLFNDDFDDVTPESSLQPCPTRVWFL